MKNANLFSKLIKSVLAEEDVIISRAGKPLVRLIPYWCASKPRTPGAWKGRITISDDFDDESEEINAMFYGESE